MLLAIKRRPSFKGATTGELSIDGVFACFTLEDEVREVLGQPVAVWKVNGKTAIPVGRYRVTLDHSSRFGPDTLTVNSVPGFQYIRMHAGNTQDDTEGCPLLGMRLGSDGKSILGGTSKPAVALVKDKVKRAIVEGQNVWLEIWGAP